MAAKALRREMVSGMETGFECGRCDHELIRGVACDGQWDDCPVRVDMAERHHSRPTHTQVYLLEVDGLALPGEFDAVRGDS